MADSKISALTSYTTALDADVVPIVDTANSITKKITWANLKATLKTYFDTLYTTGSPVVGEVVSGSSNTFTLSFTPTAGSYAVYGIGQRLTEGAGNDFTLSGAVITTANPFSAGQILADYRH